MDNQKKFRMPINSLRFRIIISTVSLILLLLVLLLFNNLYAIRVVHNQVFESNKRTLALYMQQIDGDFKDMEKYLIGLQIADADLPLLEKITEDPIEFYTGQTRVQRNLGAAILSYSSIDALFVYSVDGGVFTDTVKTSITGSEVTQIRIMIDKAIKDNEMVKHAGKWIPLEANGEYYLVRLLKFRRMYLGGCVKVSNLLNGLKQTGYGGMDYLSFYQNSGEEMGHHLPELLQKIHLENNTNYFTIVGNKNKYMTLVEPSACGDYSLIAMIRENSILEGLGSFQALIVILFLCLLIMIPLFIAVLRYWIIKPLNNLIGAMKKLKNGNLDNQLETKDVCEEFATVYKNFDDMSQQIQRLKIDVYEESVQRQRADLQYLQLQMNPHFYINCFNVIHSLAGMNKTDLVQEMTEYLGNHPRYTLKGNSFVKLEKEIEYVKNYLRIQQLRFLDSIICNFSVEDSVLNAAVPPMVIQTFVENTVKHQVVSGEITEISIQVQRLMKETGDFIQITVWDSGEGFSDRVLDCLNNQRRLYDERGEHIGIYNIQQRLKLLYHGRAEIVFFNDVNTGGAKVGMKIPYIANSGETRI